jgi:hypothetical protein
VTGSSPGIWKEFRRVFRVKRLAASGRYPTQVDVRFEEPGHPVEECIGIEGFEDEVFRRIEDAADESAWALPVMKRMGTSGRH